MEKRFKEDEEPEDPP
jgi:casein kinase II subunit beta